MNEVGLQRHIEKKLGIPIDSLLRKVDPNYHWIGDLYEPQSFNKILLKCVPIETKSKLLVRFPQAATAVADFQTNWEMLKVAAEINSVSEDYLNPHLSGEQLDDLQQKSHQNTIEVMCKLLEILFHVMLKNEKIIYVITEMEENQQVMIKEYIEGMGALQSQGYSKHQTESPTSAKTKGWDYRREGELNQQLIDRIEELEQMAAIKQRDLHKLKEKLTRTEEQLLEKSQLLEAKQEEIELLNRRMAIYSETDSLFEEKDQQIAKLHSQLTDVKLKFHLKTTELNNQISRVKEQVKYYEEQKNQIGLQFDRINNKYQILLLQKEEGDTANKRVIANLKEKIKSLNDRVNQQQKNIMEILMEKELKDKEIYELEKKINPIDANPRRVKQDSNEEYIKSSGRKSTILGQQIGGILQQNGKDSSFKQYFDILFGNSEQRCSGELCIALRAEYVRIVHQMLKINNDLDSINYFSQETRIQCVEDQLKRISQLCHENMKLKEKIILMQQSDSLKGQPNKEAKQQISKLKKKILILKRKIDEADNQKRQELQILISSFSQSIKIQ